MLGRKRYVTMIPGDLISMFLCDIKTLRVLSKKIRKGRKTNCILLKSYVFSLMEGNLLSLSC